MTALVTDPLIDPERFAELASDFGADGARELLEALVTETDRQMGEVRAAHAGADPAALAHEAHGVKGGALLVGAVRLREAAAELERLARDHADTRAAVDALDAAWLATRTQLVDGAGPT